VRAHGASPRPANGDFDWRTESRDTLDVVDAFGLAGVKAVGHSMGGAQVLMAEEDFPGSWTSAWTFEPVAHQLPFPLPENPLAAGTRKRRDTFPSRQAAFDNFASKPPFGSFDPEALHAYVDYGFVNNGSEVVLACARDDEADTYNGELVSHVFEGLSSVKIPVQVVGGAISTHFPPDRLQAIAGELPNSTVEMMEGLGHFGPLEAPARVAESIAAALA
jgi:pimeloyl-ACP methyl ester carboxylesterase